MFNARISTALVVLLYFVLPADGHAILLSATPNVSQVMKGPDVPVTLRFNARIDAKRSRMILVTPAGAQQTLPVNESSQPDLLSSEAKGLMPGSYILRWQVLASDGHITRGEVPFVVQ